MRKLLLGALLLLSTLIFSQSKSEIIGWNKATWGMTEDELSKSFPEAVKLDEEVTYSDGIFVSIIIPIYKVGSETFKISFQMKPNRTLTNVLMELNETTFDSTFDSINNLLIEKYGESNNNQKSEYGKEIIWVYPKTKITLERIVMKNIKLDKILIQYSQREGNESTKF